MSTIRLSTSIDVSRSQEVSIADTIADLMHANLLEVFNQRDRAARRNGVIVELYSVPTDYPR